MAKALQQALKNYREHMEGREFPACATEAEFDAWKLHERELPTQPIRQFFCRDCSPAYKLQMVKEGRCPQSTVDISKIVD